MIPRLHIANILTISRIIFIPLLIALYEWTSMAMAEKAYAMTAVFIILALTDWLDGYLARRLRIESEFGSFLDPVADKILVMVSLFILLDMHSIHYMVALVLIVREVVISAWRAWATQLKKPPQTTVNYLGKIKTSAQMLAIPMFFLVPVHDFLKPWALICMYVAVVMSVLSMGSYFYASYRASPEK